MLNHDWIFEVHLFMFYILYESKFYFRIYNFISEYAMISFYHNLWDFHIGIMLDLYKNFKTFTLHLCYEKS